MPPWLAWWTADEWTTYVAESVSGGIASVNDKLAAGTSIRIPRFISYTIKKGDGLGDIAAKLLGRAKLYTLIKDTSTGPLADPTKIEVGMVLRVPLVYPELEKKLLGK